jgi:hypothetical protein
MTNGRLVNVFPDPQAATINDAQKGASRAFADLGGRTSQREIPYRNKPKS